MKLFDAIRLKVDLPEANLKAGMKGAIVEVFTQPFEAFEVEFADDQGRTIAQLPLTPDQIEPLKDA